MVHKHKGIFVVIDGLDGVGKGFFLKSIVEHEQAKGKKVFNANEYWLQGNNVYPEVGKEIPEDTDIIVTSEPTFCGAGKLIREEIISKKHNRKYPASTTASMYSSDREILHKKTLLPALKKGITVLQSRSVASSIAYQPSQADGDGDVLGVKDIINKERFHGNAFCLENGPNLLIIPTIKDVNECITRLQAREKKDYAIFENIGFQLKMKSIYESPWFRKIFEEKGTKVIYLDAGISIEESKRQAIESWKAFVGGKLSDYIEKK